MLALFASLGLGACAVAADEIVPPGKAQGGSSGSTGSGGGDDDGGGSSSSSAGSSSAGTSSPPTGGAPVVPGPSTSGSSSGGSGGGGAAAGGAGGGGSGGTPGDDTCPDDPDKTEPGKCGCGVPDVDSAAASSCIPLQNALVHRYSFEGNANDSVGTAHGTLMGGATVSGGKLTLAGAKVGQYLDLPNGLVSQLTNATFEAWVTWSTSAGGMWQRVFDFGSSTMPEGQAGEGAKYLFLSTNVFRACYTSAEPKSEIFGDSGKPFPADTVAHVAVTVNGASKQMYLYLNGESVAFTALTLPLSAINDVNNWIGRSQYENDDYFGGTISELRIYDAALTGPQLKASFKMGDSTTYLEK